MTDLREVAPLGARRGRHTVDLQWYRSELEQLRRFRLDQLTDLAYDAMATSDAPSEVTSKLMTDGSGLESATVESLPAATTRSGQHPYPATRDIVEVWGEDSFPASDPPANW